MTGPEAVPVPMTVKRERKLRQIISAGTSPQRLVLRARIIMAAAAGDSNAKIARDLGGSQTTVRKWRKRFTERGIPGIFDRPRAGRPETHGPSVRLLIIATATTEPPDGESAGRRSRSPVTCADGAWKSPALPSAGCSRRRRSGRTRCAAG